MATATIEKSRLGGALDKAKRVHAGLAERERLDLAVKECAASSESELRELRAFEAKNGEDLRELTEMDWSVFERGGLNVSGLRDEAISIKGALDDAIGRHSQVLAWIQGGTGNASIAEVAAKTSASQGLASALVARFDKLVTLAEGTFR